MEFFILFILNIFTGAVIYLILSLKIERTSATFQEKKLRKEMGEIITEFNSTAERNVTLLENRINILKKLLNDKGDFRGIDVVVYDEKVKNAKSPGLKIEPSDYELTIDPYSRSEDDAKLTVTGGESRGDGNILVGMIDKISGLSLQSEKTPGTAISKAGKEGKSRKADYLLDSEIDLSYNPAGFDQHSTHKNSSEQGDNSEDLSELFSNTTDKYSLINDLHSKGYSIDEISRFSGLPSGEVRLVISLNG